MSGINTKASKIDRILTRVRSIEEVQADMLDLLSNQRKADHNTLKLQAETIARLDAENATLRKYLGSELFARRQRDAQIPTLEPHWGNSGTDNKIKVGG